VTLAVILPMVCSALMVGQGVTTLNGSLSAGSINSVPYVDGTTNTSPQSILGNSLYSWGNLTSGIGGNEGGMILWPNISGATIDVGANGGSSYNAYSNNATSSPPTLGFGGSCGGNTVAGGGVFSVMMVGVDHLGNTWPLASVLNESTGVSGGCVQVTPPSGLSTWPGLDHIEFLPSNIAKQTMSWFSGGPQSPPYNTTGLVTFSTLLGLTGSGAWQISVPQMLGSFSAIGGLKRNVTAIQVSSGFPNAIPTLEMPFWQLNSNLPNNGNLGEAVTLAWGLFDSASGSSTLVSISEPVTTPQFLRENGTSYKNATFYAPGVALHLGCPGNGYCPLTYYWAGERTVVNQGSKGLIVQVNTNGTTGSSQPTWNTTIGGATTDADTLTWTTVGSFSVWTTGTSYTLGNRTTGEIGCLRLQEICIIETRESLVRQRSSQAETLIVIPYAYYEINLLRYVVLHILTHI
jgi:hypothetical protein